MEVKFYMVSLVFGSDIASQLLNENYINLICRVEHVRLFKVDSNFFLIDNLFCT